MITIHTSFFLVFASIFFAFIGVICNPLLALTGYSQQRHVSRFFLQSSAPQTISCLIGQKIIQQAINVLHDLSYMAT
jgi:hypothetical protein